MVNWTTMSSSRCFSNTNLCIFVNDIFTIRFYCAMNCIDCISEKECAFSKYLSAVLKRDFGFDLRKSQYLPTEKKRPANLNVDILQMLVIENVRTNTTQLPYFIYQSL